MLSFYVNKHVQSKCYEYYVKEKSNPRPWLPDHHSGIKIVLICFRQYNAANLSEVIIMRFSVWKQAK